MSNTESIITPKRNVIFPKVVYQYNVIKKELKYIELATNKQGVMVFYSRNCVNIEKTKLE